MQSSSWSYCYCLLTVFSPYHCVTCQPLPKCVFCLPMALCTHALRSNYVKRGRKKTRLINLRSFWQWNVSQGGTLPSPPPLHASFLTFLSHVSIPSSFLMCHISQPLVTWQLFSLRVPLRQRGTELAGRQKVSLTVSKRQLGSNYKVAEILCLCMHAYTSA